jgi:hypothetical protein
MLISILASYWLVQWMDKMSEWLLNTPLLPTLDMTNREGKG